MGIGVQIRDKNQRSLEALEARGPETSGPGGSFEHASTSVPGRRAGGTEGRGLQGTARDFRSVQGFLRVSLLGCIGYTGFIGIL